MVRKPYSPEQIINKLREAEILLSKVRWTPSLGQDRGYIKSGYRYPQGV